MVLSFQSKVKPVATSSVSFAAKTRPVAVSSSQDSQEPIADRIWSSLASVVKAPLNPASYAPAVKIGVEGIAKAPEIIATAFKGGVEQAKQGVADIQTAPTALEKTEAGISAASGAASAISAPIAPILSPLAEILNRGVEKVTDIPIVQDAASALPDLPYERLGKVAGDISNIAGTAAGVAQVAKLAVKAPAKTSELVTRLTTETEKSIESSVLTKYDKGVKPLINAKTTPAKLEQYRANTIDAVKTIRNNKANLVYNDVSGEAIKGKTPRTIQEFADAIEQTKKTVFEDYDRLAKRAGDAGVAVDLAPIAKELDSVIQNPALSLTNPKAIQYATDIQERLIKAGKLDAVTAQEVVQNYNKSLEAFYRNPSYDNASQAAIDAMLANKVRESLDSGITGLTGEQYGVLKKQYGSLKAIEKDVVKASLRNARANVKGLIDFTDIFSGGQIVNGLLALNPATIGQGLTAKAIAEFYKYLNNPNRAIEKMFNAAEKLPQ